MKKIIFLITFIVLIISMTYAQDQSKQLVITEVYLDSKNQEIWFEVFNPTESDLILSSMRISGIRTPNVLPAEFRGQKGMKLKSGERLILCSDIKLFWEKFGNEIRVVEQKLLKNMLYGGFVAINNLDNIENSKKVIRLGDKGKSTTVAGIVRDNEVLAPSNDGMSYSREVKINGEVSGWLKTIPTPGK